MADTQTIIAALAAAFPTAKLHSETVAVYVRALADLPADELEPVAKAYMLEAAWFPTVRDLRRGVVERRLQLPSVDLAWEQALEWAQTPAKVKCPTGCDRGLLPGGDPVTLDRSLLDPISDEGLRAELERIIEAANRPTRLCETCDGEGEIPNPDRIQLGDAVRRATEHIGGAAAINTSENLGILRAQFLKAYERAREAAISTENLTSAGLALETTTRPMLEP